MTSTAKQFVIQLTDEEYTKIKDKFGKSDSFYNNTVYTLKISYKLALHFEVNDTFVKKHNDNSFTVFLGVENPWAMNLIPRKEKQRIIQECEEVHISNEELRDILDQYNIWIVNQKLKSTTKEGLEKFCKYYLDN